jgi:hypothetical protein
VQEYQPQVHEWHQLHLYEFLSKRGMTFTLPQYNRGAFNRQAFPSFFLSINKLTVGNKKKW